MAGLLAHLCATFPSQLKDSGMKKTQLQYKYQSDLQLREQLRIYTEFPFKSTLQIKWYLPKFEAKIEFRYSLTK